MGHRAAHQVHRRRLHPEVPGSLRPELLRLRFPSTPRTLDRALSVNASGDDVEDTIVYGGVIAGEYTIGKIMITGGFGYENFSERRSGAPAAATTASSAGGAFVAVRLTSSPRTSVSTPSSATTTTTRTPTPAPTCRQRVAAGCPVPLRLLRRS